MFKWAKLSFLIFICLFHYAHGQNSVPQYRITFKDKAFSPFSLDNSSEFISEKAIQRRQKFNIPLENSDLPVSPAYIDSIKQTGVSILSVSKWLNTIVIATDDSVALNKISMFSFVNQTENLRNKNIRLKPENKFETPQNIAARLKSSNITNDDYGLSFNQINMVDGDYLHNIGFTGAGKTIAILDAGFFKVDSLPAFSRLFANNQILGTKNFVNNINVYDAEHHGMNVLSVMGGYLNKSLIGTAPDASYWLLRSEDGDYEYITEEDFWVAAAEYADSAGVDIINSSLGYTTFDDSTQNHTYADLDGKTTVAAKGANMAAKKGILVICSAGNSGASSWKHIGTPADADSALAIGAVNPDETYADFSSIGFSNSNKVKPNVSAQGRSTVVASAQGGIQFGSGTSFSGPIISGLAACLWQAFPDKNNMEIYKAIEQSANQYENPDSLLGYGIPDFTKAYRTLAESLPASSDQLLNVFPVPFSSHIDLDFISGQAQEIKFEIIDFLGRTIISQELTFFKNDLQSINFNNLERLNAGVYFLRIKSIQNTFIRKIIKSHSN